MTRVTFLLMAITPIFWGRGPSAGGNNLSHARHHMIPIGFVRFTFLARAVSEKFRYIVKSRLLYKNFDRHIAPNYWGFWAIDGTTLVSFHAHPVVKKETT